MGFLKGTVKALDKTAEFVGKNRSKVVAHTGKALSSDFCGGCGKRSDRKFNGRTCCGKWSCQKKITAKVYG